MEGKLDDKKIIEMLFSRDESAIEEVREKYSSLCRDVSMRILGNREDAKECENDTYLKLNDQQDGVRSYGKMVDLLLAYRRSL